MTKHGSTPGVGRPTYIIELTTADPSMTEQETVRAIRRALKTLLRRDRLRCTRISPAPVKSDDQTWGERELDDAIDGHLSRDDREGS